MACRWSACRRERGVPLSANTLAQASGRAVDLLDPIVRQIFHQAVSSKYFGFHSTGIRVLDTEHPLGTRTGALWLLQGDHCYAYFMYASSGHVHHLEARLTVTNSPVRCATARLPTTALNAPAPRPEAATRTRAGSWSKRCAAMTHAPAGAQPLIGRIFPAVLRTLAGTSRHGSDKSRSMTVADQAAFDEH
jgi:hypothetical protein